MQTIFQRLHLSLANYVGDTVGTYTADGKTVLKTKREQALNGAISSIYEAYLNAYLKQYPLNGFGNFYNDFVVYRGEKSYTFTGGLPNSTALVKPTDPSTNDVRRYMRARLNVANSHPVLVITNKTAHPLTEEQFHKGMTRPTSNYKPTAGRPWFYETSTHLRILFDTVPTAIHSGDALFTVLLQPVYVVTSSTGNDVVVPPQWEAEIVSLAAQILMNNRNS